MKRLIVSTLAGLLVFCLFAVSAQEVETKPMVCIVEFTKKETESDINKFAEGLSECVAGDLLYFTNKSASKLTPALRVCVPETINYPNGFVGNCVYSGELLDVRENKFKK